MIIIDGKKIADEIISELKRCPLIRKKFVAVFVGADMASASFLRQKQKTAEELGIGFELMHFREAASEAEVIAGVAKAGADPTVGGIIVQLPLPKKFDAEKIIEAMPASKDLDALKPGAKVLSPVVETALAVLRTVGYETKDKIIVVVGKGVLVGRPLIDWFTGKCKELIVCDTTTGLGALSRADLVLSGVGKPDLINPEILKAGAGVIDFGYSSIDGRLKGDLNSEKTAVKNLSFYTPTPGGTGPILVAELFKNFYQANKEASIRSATS